MRPCPPFGLFDVLAHRDFARNGLVYLAYSEIRPGENWPAGQTRVIRGRLHEGALVEQRGDEINLFLPGRNYGWPVITHGMNYDGTALCESPEKEGMEQPVHFWVPSIAPCGIGFYTGDLFPRWKYNLFVTSLAAQELQRLEIEGNRVVSREIVFKNLGRMRAVVTGPEGALYVLLADRISRLTPVEQVAPPSKSE